MSVDLRLVLPAAACWVAAGLLVGVPAVAGGVSAVLLGVAVLLVGLLWMRTRAAQRRGRALGHRAASGAVLVCLAAAGLASFTVAQQAPNRLPAMVQSLAADSARVTAIVTVGAAPVPSPSTGFGGAGATQVRLAGTLTELPGRRDVPSVLTVPVVVFTEAPEVPLGLGTSIRLSGTLAATEPGDGAAVLLFGRSTPEVLAEPPWWLDWANELRAGFQKQAATLPGEGGNLLPGLAIGDTSAVGVDLDAAMKASSLSHLTAVSGANCAVVTALVLLVTSVLGFRRFWRITLSLLVLAGFVVLVTPEPSVLRAASMATIVLLSVGFGRPGRGLTAVALAVLVLLVADPWLSRNYGFALSVLATVGLLVLSAPLARLLARWLPAPLAMALAIPLAAQVACQPVLVLLSPTLPLFGVPANLLAGPAAPVATVLGLIGCLLVPVLPWAASAVIWLAWLPATWIAAVAESTAGLPASSLPWLEGAPGAGLALLCTVAGLLLLLGRPTARGEPGRKRSALLRTASGALLCIVAGGFLGIAVGAGVGRAAVFPADWQIAACDIGQGDAVLVRGGDQVALIDAGPDPAPLTDCLNTLGVDRIDLLVLTHYDLDHVGGLDAVIGRVDAALVGVPESGRDAALPARLEAAGATVRQAARGDRGLLGSLGWEVLWPLPDAKAMETGNDGSVSMVFDGLGIRSVFLGDLGEDAQAALLAAGPIGRADVVKVAHHGSSDQSAELYSQLRAGVGLVSVGADNGYGHPTRSLLATLRSTGTLVERTDRNGLVVIGPAGNGQLRVWTERVWSAE